VAFRYTEAAAAAVESGAGTGLELGAELRQVAKHVQPE